MKIVQTLASSINTRTYLHAGSHLGAILHGQMIPWDDDVDIFIDYNKRDKLFSICKNLRLDQNLTLKCTLNYSEMKIWIEDESYTKMTTPEHKFGSPYIDVFFFRISGNKLYEVVAKTGRIKTGHQRFIHEIEQFFPTQPYYFGGM